MTTAPQNLHFEQGPCNHFECMLYYWQKERWNTSSIRCVSSRRKRLWPHLWPSTASDYVDTVRRVALESIDFRYKSTENHPKVLILQGFYGSGRRSRKFESCHLDQKIKAEHLLPFDFCLCRCFEIVIFTPELQSSTIERYAWSATAACGRWRERDKGKNKENRNRQGASRLCFWPNEDVEVASRIRWFESCFALRRMFHLDHK